MTRHRKGVRPLSQTGFHRIPMNPRQRNFGEGGVKKAGTVLDAFNETQEHRNLHPTKGYRKVNMKRSRAQMVMAELRAGHGMTTADMAAFLRA
jgi:hypothetical protein